MTSYNPTLSTELCEIMGRHGSDKGSLDNRSSWHNYTTLYHALFNTIRGRVSRVFELGLGTNNISIPSNMGINGKPGASLRGWREYFTKASVFGGDIDSNILFEEDRIKTYYCDQTNPTSISDLWNAPELKDGFDIIIEDGLHTFDANACFFENSIHKLNAGGYYIIEDISNQDLHKFEDILSLWRKKYPEFTFKIETIPHTNTHDNRVLIVYH